MELCSSLGQPVADQILTAALASMRTSHAYLFVGPEGTGKTACALEFARALVDTAQNDHPDVLVVAPDGASLKIDQARRIQRELSLSPVMASRRVAVIKQADKMTIEAANSLLKLLEEPPSNSVLILVASNPSALLPTVLSRCQTVPFRPASLDAVERYLVENGIHAEKAASLAALSGGIIGRALALDGTGGEAKARSHAIECVRNFGILDPWTLVSKLPNDRAELLEMTSFLAWLVRDAIAKAEGTHDRVLVNLDSLEEVARLADSGSRALQNALKQVMLTRRRIERNCNTALALELLFIKLERLLASA